MLRRLMMAGGGGGTDPYFANVSALLHCNGASGSSTFTDSGPYGHTFTNTGFPVIDASRSVFGGACGFFATGRRINAGPHASFGFGTGDLCFESWCYFDSLYVTPRIMGNLAGGTWGANKWVVANSSSGFQFYANNYNAGSPLLSSAATGLTGWHFLAITRSGSSWRLFIDGTIDATGTFSGSLDGGGSQTFHAGGSGAAVEFYNGGLDDIRITKGVPRYTANFTPPTAQFPDS